eukprot:1180280-Prorocentrum_minimum.AAC.2
MPNSNRPPLPAGPAPQLPCTPLLPSVLAPQALQQVPHDASASDTFRRGIRLACPSRPPADPPV